MISFMSVGGGISFTWLWLLIAVTFAVIEAMTLGIVSIWFAIGALIAMLVALIIDSFMIQLLVFIIVSLILVATTRRIAINYLKIGRIKTNIDELIGKEAIVIKPIEPYHAGEVKLDGKIWRAVSETKQIYNIDEIIIVLRIEGVTIITK